ncbi:hypothetical protein [Flavobacterium tistrianum]|uniref:hypothetical protein n=1 Tax=Flavobacterium tistrianum TaxID=1685414 RepID=UPI000DAC1F67|nr:hypothetical protein [Flavobacterium tistrianum]KAF2340059.1 hypothetical protein DMB71_16480 [Flavobacterium tistrianum]
MKKIHLLILFSVTYFFFSCGNDEKKQPKKVIQSVNKLTPAAVKIPRKVSSKSITASKEFESPKTASQKNPFAVKNPIAIPELSPQIPTHTPSTTTSIKKEVNEELLNFVNVRKILAKCKMGQTMTQKQLTEHFEIPEEAVKLIKSVTKTAENELSVKWKSTWLVEKVSDAELEDGKMKVKFKANKMYMSGNAIGIKYNRKIYTNLIIIGRSAYIPSVKGYSWQIGR